MENPTSTPTPDSQTTTQEPIPPNPAPAAPSGETVSRAEFDKVMAELHKHKKSAQSLREEKENEKIARMKEQNQWKELAEAKEREASEAKVERDRIQNSYLNERKYSAVREKCASLGIRPEAVSDLEMLDLESVTIETTSTGKINILGADKFAERLKTLKPHWFSDPKVPTVNASGTRVLDSNAAISPSDLLKAEVEGRKSGDMSKYYDLHKKFQQQRLAGSRR